MSVIGAIVKSVYGKELTENSGNGVKLKHKKWGKVRECLEALDKVVSSRRTIALVIKGLLILIAIVIVVEAVFQFNLLTSWYTTTCARRADVDREFQRRSNLIPNLVYAAENYAIYEKSVFNYVSDARKALRAVQSSGGNPVEANNELSKALFRLIALAEEYPDLKATQSIQDLIRESSNTENRIAEAKQKYNHAAEVFNQCMSTFPGNVFAHIYGYSLVPYIGTEETIEVPSMELKIH